MPNSQLEKPIKLVVGEAVLRLNVPDSVIEIDDWEKQEALAHDTVVLALDNPIDFPALNLAFVQGDRIAIAVEPGFPETESLVLEVVEYLLRNGAQSNDVAIVLAHHHQWLKERLATCLTERLGKDFNVEVHNEHDHEQMGYLAADHNAEPIYVNRSLLEADFVLPITCARDPKSWAYAGLYGIVPWFTDAKTQQRWRQEAARQDQSQSRKRMGAAKEVAWLLGIQPVLAVVPGSHGRIENLFYGVVEKVDEAIEQQLASRAIGEPNQRAALLVATIDGDRDQQTWDNVARILYLAERFLQPDGSIAIVSDLDEPPGSVFRWLASPDERETAERHLLKSSHPNALAAVEILRSQSRHQVYLMSHLPAEHVEEWGLAPIKSSHELEHLIQAHPTTIIISGAQHRRLAK